ncbi:tyrosine-type recombinase/integrase [Flavihumibacter sp. UBA7668]|uniref:tyrosine-type recombinase/integrase n=1 Tax=Flavihumibacter sp. UBA7668 TaxID=1946542 RepID=UPI0025C469A8|nr:tyrosine-type recombinase/integrase [Flavihumibacter sp. UBA7668]
MSVTIDPTIDDFLSYLALEKRYASTTLRAYQDDLLVFRDFLVVEFDVSDLLLASTVMVRSWLSSLKDGRSPLAASSIGRKLSSLRSFYKYYLKKGRITVSPVAQLSAPKAAKRLPVYLEEKQAKQLLLNTSSGDGWKGWTTKLVMAIFYQTGMRLSELVNLQHQQIDPYQKNLRVWGKGGKERIIPIQPALIDLIREYEENKKRDWGSFELKDQLLVTEKGKPVYPKYIYRLVRSYLAELTTLKKKSPHVLRHSFATHLLNEGAELNAVKELLGHASLAATQVYTHNTIGKLKEVHKKAHPKG